MVYWLPAGGLPVYVGASPVSTGRIGQFDHFETPTGVYAHTLANPDFRAQGTKNANGILGYGAKGMRVYDFGWQQALRGWGNGGISTMRLQMHATDPVLLEPKLGTPQSKGCIRIPATLNRLLDSFGLLDADYELAADLIAPPWVLQPGRTPVFGAGRYLIIVDTGRDSRPGWAVPARTTAAN
ncbi:L,D-transpeptidase [Achromobacter mucicolens]|uniref:L,D-transpeptidase n=1 Tax=Achromobacter mucicolens TaxID=1389922 RepID=UPI003260148B